MRCQRCLRSDASVHLLEVMGSARRSVWLCADCAAEQEREPSPGAGREPLVSFLGPEPGGPPPGGLRACPLCETTLDDLRRDNRLGCARCYSTFRGQLLPLLARYHRHVSHVGRVPSASRQPSSRLVEITRLRVSLAKAIAVEDFERAASLRDRLRDLEEAGTSPPGVSA
jgi:protein arginine kinase activator